MQQFTAWFVKAKKPLNFTKLALMICLLAEEEREVYHFANERSKNQLQIELIVFLVIMLEVTSSTYNIQTAIYSPYNYIALHCSQFDVSQSQLFIYLHVCFCQECIIERERESVALPYTYVAQPCVK